MMAELFGHQLLYVRNYPSGVYLVKWKTIQVSKCEVGTYMWDSLPAQCVVQLLENGHVVGPYMRIELALKCFWSLRSPKHPIIEQDFTYY